MINSDNLITHVASKHFCVGTRGWLSRLSTSFGSGHDPRVLGSSPVSCRAPCSVGSLPLPLPPAGALSISLSLSLSNKINKILKKKNTKNKLLCLFAVTVHTSSDVFSYLWQHHPVSKNMPNLTPWNLYSSYSQTISCLNSNKQFSHH